MIRRLALRSSPRVPHARVLLLATALLASFPASARQGSSPEPPSNEQPTLMKVLTKHDLHNVEHESWNAYGQFTYISSWKPHFDARYTNKNGSINSLLPDPER